MTMYSGDMKPIILASGTEITAGTTVNITAEQGVCVARVAKPILYVKAHGTGLTGTVDVSYKMSVADLPSIAEVTQTTTMVLISTGYYVGYASVTTDLSTMTIVKVKNSTGQTITSYEVGVTGLITY